MQPFNASSGQAESCVHHHLVQTGGSSRLLCGASFSLGSPPGRPAGSEPVKTHSMWHVWEGSRGQAADRLQAVAPRSRRMGLWRCVWTELRSRRTGVCCSVFRNPFLLINKLPCELQRCTRAHRRFGHLSELAHLRTDGFPHNFLTSLLAARMGCRLNLRCEMTRMRPAPLTALSCSFGGLQGCSPLLSALSRRDGPGDLKQCTESSCSSSSVGLYVSTELSPGVISLHGSSASLKQTSLSLGGRV